MLDAGGGGGYGGTDWSHASVIDMWMTLQNQDTTPHWQLVDGWRKSYELTLQHMSAVRSYRENLATVWPPEKSPAAAAYMARLDELMGHLQETYDAAIANHSAFSSATLSISSSRTDLEKVVTEYLANEAELVDFERAKEVAAMPVGGKGGGQRTIPKNPVANGRQAELVARARSIMSSLSVDLIQARSQICKPAPYGTTSKIGDPGKDDGTGYVPPSIPPVIPFDPEGSPSSFAGSSSAHAQSVQPVSQPPSTGQGRLPGLVLGGTQPPVIAPPAPSPINPTMPGGPSGPIGPGAPIAPVVTSPQRPRTGATGGVVGGRTIGNQSQIGRPIPTVNPVGGVITPNNPSGGRGAARPGVQPVGPLAGGPAAAEDESSSKQWDPDNPWQTAKGVDPVLMPSEEPPIDPGPAIGLS